MRLASYVLLSIGLRGLSPVGGPATASAQSAVTFAQAMTMVEQRNERWRAADLALNRARETRAVQRGLYWPTVGVVGRYVHLDDELFVDLSPLNDLIGILHPGVPVPPLTATVLENDPAKVTVGASWTVFAGGRVREWSSSRSNTARLIRYAWDSIGSRPGVKGRFGHADDWGSWSAGWAAYGLRCCATWTTEASTPTPSEFRARAVTDALNALEAHLAPQSG